MASEKYLPGLWKTVLNWLRVSAKPKSKINEPIFQGEDLNGNLYFETFDKYGRRLRTVEPKHVDTIAIPMLPEITISPEWIRWLRFVSICYVFHVCFSVQFSFSLLQCD